MIRLWPGLALVMACGMAGAEAAAAQRLRVGLALGGGGARGSAHIGVLSALQELRVPIDCVAGTSMGALVAGAYASGMPLATMREQLAQADWRDLFVDSPEFSEAQPRVKDLARHYLPGSESGVNLDKGVRLQGGVVAGQKIKLFFNAVVRSNQGEYDIDKLPLPLAIIATDISNGERVVFRDGALSQAMRASMSVPGLLAPADYRGRKLVDGGLVDNLPVTEVRDLCQPDVVIAVNVGSPLLKPEELSSPLAVSAQMVNILTEQNVARSRALLGSADFYLQPDLAGIGAGDFEKHAAAVDAGYRAVRALTERLAPLAVPPEVYGAWRERIEVTSRASPKVHEVRVVGLERVDPAVVERHLSIRPGDPVRRSAINRDLLRIYGDGYYESVDYSVLDENGRTVLRVAPVEKPWGPDYLRFGLNLQVDSNEGSEFALRAAYHATWLNRLGAELLLGVDLGSRHRVAAAWHQPLDPRQTWFADFALQATQTRQPVYEDGERLAGYLVNEAVLNLDLGRNLGLLGPLRFGWEQRRRAFKRDVGPAALPEAVEDVGGWRLGFDFDQFDRLHFPTRGWSARATYFSAESAPYSRIEADVQAAGALGNTVLHLRGRYIGSPRGELPPTDAGQLGGFHQLAAFTQNRLLGDEMRYLGLHAERIVGTLPLGLRGDMRFGVGLEAARIGKPYTETQYRGDILSAALYFGGETPFGPAWLGVGRGSGNVWNLFLFVGLP